MKTYHLNTPKGTKDILLEECQVKREIEQKLLKVFVGYGYLEVITPGIEFLDVFLNNYVNADCENMYKLVDSEGRILVLRPDSTSPIARLVATRLKNSSRPIRLYYNQRVYLQKGMYSGKSNETCQMGIELIGANTAKADLEVISMAATALKQYNDQDFRIEIGHSGFVEILMKHLAINENQKEEIRMLIGLKNYAGLNDLLDSLEESEATDALKQLPRLFGQEEVFQVANNLFKDEEAKETLEYLRWLYDALIQMGLKDAVMLDLGFVNSNNYYTGVIFRGYVQGLGEVVLSGGRYDQLLGLFGERMPAIGFGINVDILTKKQLEQSGDTKINSPEVLVYGEPGYDVLCLQYAHTLRQQPNLIVENALIKNIDECLEYARSKGIPKVHIVGKTIEILNVDLIGGNR